MIKEDVYWDADAWAKFNKENLDERKKEWRYIEHNLKVLSSTMLKGKYLPAHKKLFFKGEVSQDLVGVSGGREFGYALALFVLWYHPNLNQDAITRMIEWHWTSYKKAVNVSRVRETIDLTCMQYGSSFHDDYGFMGGKEEKIVQAFWGSGTDGVKFDRVTDPRRSDLTTRQELLGPRAAWFFWRSVMIVLGQGERAKHHPGIYLREYALAKDLKLNETCEGTVKRVAPNCLFFDESPKVKKDSPVARECRDSVLLDYKERRYPADVLKIWDRVVEGEVEGEVDFGV